MTRFAVDGEMTSAATPGVFDATPGVFDAAPADRRWMARALALARRAGDEGEVPVGAVLVRGEEILGGGWNRPIALRDPTAHAEIEAIREACRRLEDFQLEGCDVYASTEPCPMCMGALYWARPARVFFASGREAAAAAGFDDAFIYEEFARPPDRRRLEARRVEVEEAGTEFAAWTANEVRRDY